MAEKGENENLTHYQLKFPDWKPYQSLTNKIPQEIRYIPPQAREDLRKKIVENQSNLEETDVKLLLIILKFLEQGQMIDSFQSDEEKRHQFLLQNNVVIELENGGKKPITLYQLSKETNKLSGNAISRIIIIGQMIASDHNLKLDEETRNKLKEKADELTREIENKKQNPGYFTPKDLKPVDDFALELFNILINKSTSGVVL